MFKTFMGLFAFITCIRIVADDGMGANVPEEQEGAEENENTQNPQASQVPSAPDADDEAMQGAITKDEAKLSLLQEEYNTMADRLHDEFEELVEKNPKAVFSDDEIETLEVGSSLSAKNKLFRDKFEEFRSTKLAEKKQVIDKFGEELRERKEQFNRGSVAKRFAAANPDIDMTILAEFIQEDLSPRTRKELLTQAGEDKTKFLELVAAEYKKQNPTNSTNEEDELPPDLNSLSGASGTLGDVKNEEDYLRQIGAKR
jgi:hypothetical protein